MSVGMAVPCVLGQDRAAGFSVHLGTRFVLPLFVSRLIPAHPALVNAIVLVLHSVAGSTPLPAPETSSRGMSSGSYRDMPGTFSHGDERVGKLQGLCYADTVPLQAGKRRFGLLIWKQALSSCALTGAEPGRVAEGSTGSSWGASFLPAPSFLHS